MNNQTIYRTIFRLNAQHIENGYRTSIQSYLLLQFITSVVCIYLPPDKEHRCSDPSGSPDPVCCGRELQDPLLVFAQTARSSAEVTGRTCLLAERKERRKEGNPKESEPTDGTGIQVFTLDPSFNARSSVFDYQRRDTDLACSRVCVFFYV